MTRTKALEILSAAADGARFAASVVRKAEAIAGERGERAREIATNWREERRARIADKRQFVNSRA